MCLLAAGCAGSGESSTSTSAVGALPPASGKMVDLSTAEAKGLSRSMLVRLGDLPAGWTSAPTSEDESCAGIQDLTDRYDVLAYADSDNFSQGAKQVSSSAGIFRHESESVDALEYMETSVQSDRFRECLNDEIGKESDEDVTFGEIKIRRASFPALGDGSSAWEVIVPFEAQGTYATAFVDAVFVRRGNALAIVLSADIASPLASATLKRLARLVESRMDRAAARMS
jgi:hypothetical protein